jgi:hypothetical protein
VENLGNTPNVFYEDGDDGDQAKKVFDTTWARLGILVDNPSSDEYNIKPANVALAESYATIAEGKILHILASDATSTVKTERVMSEYTKLAKMSKQLDVRIKTKMHKAINTECDSLMLDA